MLADEVGEDLGIGVGEEVVAGGEELGFEVGVVFDGAVVDEGEETGLVEVRVGVGVGGFAVGGPASVADAEVGGGWSSSCVTVPFCDTKSSSLRGSARR